VGRALAARPGSSTALFALDIDRLAALAPDVILHPGRFSFAATERFARRL
jgi:hypothetical protein